MDQQKQELELRFAETDRALHGLTQRQRAVLAGVCAGQPTKSIAADLGVSKRLVELERSRLLRAFKAIGSAQVAVRIGEHHAMNVLGFKHVSPVHEESSSDVSSSAPELVTS